MQDSPLKDISVKKKPTGTITTDTTIQVSNLTDQSSMATELLFIIIFFIIANITKIHW